MFGNYYISSNSAAIEAAIKALELAALKPQRTYGPGRKSSGLRRGWNRYLHKQHGDREVSRRLRQECMKLMKGQDLWDGTDLETLSYSRWDELVSDPEAYSKFRNASVAKLLEITSYLRTEG